MDRDLPFTFIIGAPARHTINNTTVGVSISTRPPIKTAHMRLSTGDRTALRRPNSTPKPPSEMAPVGPGLQGAEGLGVSHASEAISVGGRMPARSLGRVSGLFQTICF
jgi:hypothetical protein